MHEKLFSNEVITNASRWAFKKVLGFQTLAKHLQLGVVTRPAQHISTPTEKVDLERVTTAACSPSRILALFLPRPEWNYPNGSIQV